MTNDQQMFVNAVTAMYLRDGRAHTVVEIAAETGWPVSKVRRVILAAPGGAMDGVNEDRETRASHSRNYPGIEAGVHRVSVFYPTLAHLRRLIVGV